MGAKIYICFPVIIKTHMSHETHGHQPTEKKSVISMRSSFWFVLILVGLFIAALNFISVMSSSHEKGHGTSHSTTEEHAVPATGETDHSSSATPAGDTHHEGGEHSEETHEEGHH